LSFDNRFIDKSPLLFYMRTRYACYVSLKSAPALSRKFEYRAIPLQRDLSTKMMPADAGRYRRSGTMIGKSSAENFSASAHREIISL
jgi:hypothetical protein